MTIGDNKYQDTHDGEAVREEAGQYRTYTIRYLSMVRKEFKP
jgi:hypothetical protein